MATIGIDIGGHTHVAARCREGQAQADRKILRLTQSGRLRRTRRLACRASPEPIERVVMESRATIWMALRCIIASHRCPGPVCSDRSPAR